VLRPVAPDIQRAIQESVAAGMTYRDAAIQFGVSLRTIARYARDYQRRQNQATVCGLTELQLKVVCQVAYGLSNRGIATELTIHTNTVRNQIHHALRKLKLVRRSQLVIFAHQLRLVCLDDVILFGDEEDEQDE
jgi:DNA-binding NarL/FixJ family response regulator